jgi:ribosome modulation factor
MGHDPFGLYNEDELEDAYGKGYQDGVDGTKDISFEFLEEGFGWLTDIFKDDEDRSYDAGYEDGKQSNSGCYLTTACVEAKGLPDDCLELTILRRFRDIYIPTLPGGLHVIDDYYAVAPRIVELIDIQPDRYHIYEGLYDDFVRRSVDLIQQGRHEEAFGHYQKHVQELEARFI